MNIADIMAQTGALNAIARQMGIDPATAKSGADALLPAILGGFKKQAQPSGGGGLGGLMDILGQGGGGNLLDHVTSDGPTSADPGNAILGQIFGSKDVSRTVAGQAAQSSGVDPSILKKMLPLLAMAVTGYLATQKGGAAPAQPSGGGLGGGLGGLLGQILGGGGGASGSSAHAGASQAQSGGLGGLGGLASLIDLDGDGNPLDDILGMAGRLGR